MKRIRIDRLQAGDIVLTAGMTKAGKAVRLASGGIVSHAMICAQHGSIIDSTAEGVQARNLQREFFEEDKDVFAFRHRKPLPAVTIAGIVGFARSEIGTRYSTKEAIRSVVGSRKPRDNQQFCSRLVARALSRRKFGGGYAGCAITAPLRRLRFDPARLWRNSGANGLRFAKD